MAKLLTGTRIYGTGTVDTQLFVNGTDQSTSTSTGALEVVGGVGIGGNLYVGGISVLPGVQASNIVASGSLGVTGTSVLGVVNATSATFSGTIGVTGTSVLGVVNATSATFSGTLGVTGTSVFAGLTTITNTTSATSTSTGAFQVRGGVGIGQDLLVGGTIYGIFNGSITGTATTATNIAGGTAGQVPYQTAAGVTSFYGPGTAGNVLVSNGTSAPTYNNTLTLTGTTSATSTQTGALQVVGGVGVGNNIVVGGYGRFTGIYDEVTTAPGVYLGVAGSPPPATPRIGFFNSTSTQNWQIDNYNGTFRWFTPGVSRMELSPAGILVVNTNSNATSTSTGALQVVGGVGIGGDLFIRGDIATSDITFNLINSTATTVNFAGAATALTVGATSGSTTVRNNLSVAGNLTVQGTTTIVDSTVTNIADPIITLGGGASNAAPTVDDNKDRGIAFKWVNNGGTTSTGFFGYDDSTGFLTYIQTATITNEVVSGTKGAVDANLAGGAAMSLVYQSAANTTAFLAAGTGGFILQTNGTGSAPTWVSASGIGAGSATNADAIRTIASTASTVHYLTFVDSNNPANAYESVYTTSSFSINPQSGNVSIGGSITASTIGSTFALGIAAPSQTGQSAIAHIAGGHLKIDSNRQFVWDGAFPSFISGSSGAGGSININAGNSGAAVQFLTQGIVKIQSTIAASATNTAALQVVGGVGIGGALYVDRGSIIGNDTFASWGPIYRALQVGKTSALYGVNSGFGGNTTISDNVYITSGGTSTYLVSNYATKYSQNLSAGIHAWYTATSGTAGNAITFVEAMRITESGGLGFGAAGAFGSAGQVLQSNGNAPPTWVTITPGGGTSTQVNTVLQVSNGTYYPTFVDSNNATATSESLYTTSSFSINPSTGATDIQGVLSTYRKNTEGIRVATAFGSGGNGTGEYGSIGFYGNLGGAGDNKTGEIRSYNDGGFYGSLEFFVRTNGGASPGTDVTRLIKLGGQSNNVTVYSTATAISTTTGALQVVNGGAGIGGNIYAGGDIYSRGRILTPAAVQEFTATGSQTIFTVSGGYAVGTVQVFANGINLGSADIVASNGTTVTLLEPRAAGDIIRITSGGTASTINNIQNFSIAMSIAMSM